MADPTPAEYGMDFLDQIDPMLEILDGYRAKLIARGYSESSAEQMCVHMHGEFCRAMGDK